MLNSKTKVKVISDVSIITMYYGELLVVESAPKRKRRLTESDAGRRRFVVDPERYPRQHDDQHRRKVVLEQEETDVAFQLEAQRQPLIMT